MYITAWLGVLDNNTGLLKYANAGHMIAPLIYDGSKTESLTAHGFPICRWISAAQFQQQERKIDKGTRILLYTDGLSDAWRTLKPDRQDDMYQTPDALAEACLKMNNFKEILQSIWEQVSPDDNTRDLSDDIAMLLVEKTT